MHRSSRARIAVWTLLSSLACATPPPDDVLESPVYTLSREQQRAGWTLLFGGRSLDAWRGYRTQTIPSGWSIVAGALRSSGRLGTPDLVTRETFRDFELVLEFRSNTPERNSGVLFHVTEQRWQTYHTGPEFQILDGASDPLRRTGANYALHPVAGASIRPSGAWNEARIVVRGATVQHWLNGQLALTYELWSDDWERRVTASKFARMPDYGRSPEGHIALQSEHSPVWFRNIRVRRLAP